MTLAQMSCKQNDDAVLDGGKFRFYIFQTIIINPVFSYDIVIKMTLLYLNISLSEHL